MSDRPHDAERLADWTATAIDLWTVTAIVQPFRLDPVSLALEGLPECHGVTISDCRGFGHAKLSRERQAPNRRDVIDYARHVRIDCMVAGRFNAIDVARTIAIVAHTGNEGDGKVFIAPLSGAVAIRDFDVDELAL
jgi:nitrogen regulatory protein P-II 1